MSHGTGRKLRVFKQMFGSAWLGGVATLLLLVVLASCLAEVVAPHRPFDVETIDQMDAVMPPAWLEGGAFKFLLGTDAQGRDVLSSILYGLRISLVIAVSAVLISVVLGVGIGLLAGWSGGVVNAALMRLCDVLLAFPAILVALMFDGVARALMPDRDHLTLLLVLVGAIALTGWVPYARAVRAGVLRERGREYVLSARLLAVPSWRLAVGHVLPNVMSPVWVLASLQVGTAILIEATLSFLGVGVPATTPSLGSLIRLGNDLLFSGEWWVAVFPGAVLALVVIGINVVADVLRDLLNPRLQ